MDASDIPNTSDYPNILSSPELRIGGKACEPPISYTPKMPKKRRIERKPGPDWFLPEWMKSLQVSQADLVRSTDWSPATVNDIYHGRTEYYRGIVNEIAQALHIQPFELLLHPDEAMALRRLRDSAVRIAAEAHVPFISESLTAKAS